MDTASPASWDSRFWAWLIDILLVGLFCSMFRDCLGIAGSLGIAESFGLKGSFNLEALGIELAAFVYWTVLDGYRGQSIGKMVMIRGLKGSRAVCPDLLRQSQAGGFSQGIGRCKKSHDRKPLRFWTATA